jgi:hypothetical protein
MKMQGGGVERVRVVIRVRPALKREVGEDGTLNCSVTVDPTRRKVFVSRDGKPFIISPNSSIMPENVYSFEADYIHPPEESTHDLYMNSGRHSRRGQTEQHTQGVVKLSS